MKMSPRSQDLACFPREVLEILHTLIHESEFHTYCLDASVFFLKEFTSARGFEYLVELFEVPQKGIGFPDELLSPDLTGIREYMLHYAIETEVNHSEYNTSLSRSLLWCWRNITFRGSRSRLQRGSWCC